MEINGIQIKDGIDATLHCVFDKEFQISANCGIISLQVNDEGNRRILIMSKNMETKQAHEVQHTYCMDNTLIGNVFTKRDQTKSDVFVCRNLHYLTVCNSSKLNIVDLPDPRELFSILVTNHSSLIIPHIPRVSYLVIELKLKSSLTVGGKCGVLSLELEDSSLQGEKLIVDRTITSHSKPDDLSIGTLGIRMDCRQIGNTNLVKYLIKP